MGGRGSGRPAGFRTDTVERYPSIDVNWARRAGCLVPGRQTFVSWPMSSESTLQVSMRALPGRLRLTYRSGLLDVDYSVGVENVPCHFGGSRPLLICTGVVDGKLCNRRVGKLYKKGAYFLCRHCHRLTYQCQQERLWDRAARRSDKIRKRLAGELGIYAAFPDKPSRMWWRTYFRLFDKAMHAAAEAEAALLDR